MRRGKELLGGGGRRSVSRWCGRRRGLRQLAFALLEGVGLVEEVEAMSDLDDGGVGGGVRAQKVEAFEAVENMAGAASFSGEHEIGGDACHRGVSIGYV
eukprot:scaffold98480_cov48-Phaeocystis_antarctica.AAC.2